MQPPVQSSGTRRDEYQCWKDVKTETGFSDYLSYLEASDATGPQFERLRKELTSYRSFSEFGEISVLDILNDGSTSVSLGLGRVPPLDSNGDPGTQLLQALRSSPENVTARIVPWLIPWGLGLENPRIIDAVGLGLKIDPLFFDVLVSIMRPTCNKRRLIGSDYVKIGDSVVTVARDYRLEAGAPPVLLVAGSSLGNSDPLDFEVSDWRKYNSDMVEKVVEGGIGGGISLRRSTIDQRSPNYRTSNLYLKLLGKYVYQGQSFGAEDNTLLLTAILPLLHLEILRLRVQSGTIESAFLDVQYRLGKPTLYPNERKTQYYQDLDEQRFWLRRRLERLEESKRGFTKYVHLQQATKWLEVETWQKLDDDIKEAIIEARAREAEARDYMQLQIGNLSISESRKSIQLSNQQIDEAKRVKIFTILAFVYVPINLATSVFGMNLQQLNQSGQSILSFFITAIAALLITALMWFCIVQYNSVRDWKRKRYERWSGMGRKSKPSVTLRVALLLGILDKSDARNLDLV